METKRNKNYLIKKQRKFNLYRWIVFLFVFFTLHFSLSTFHCLYADFEDLGAGARAAGMGNAFTALCDDPFGLYYNPAGLGFLRQGYIGMDYGALWIGLDDSSALSTSFIAAAVPFYKTELAVDRPKGKKLTAKAKSALISHYLSNNTSTDTAKAPVFEDEQQNPFLLEKTVVKHWGTLAIGIQQFTLADYYRESAYYFAFGKSIRQKWAYGVSLKMLSENYTVDEYISQSPVFDYGQKNTVSAYGIDAGFIYNIMPRLFVGIAGNNINQPNMGLKITDNLPAVLRLGIAWKQKNIKWAVDEIYTSEKLYTAMGLEKSFNDGLALHGGFNLGGKGFFETAAGFSFNFDAMSIDYSFVFPLNSVKDTYGNHKMSMVYKFGSRPKEELEPGSLELYYSNLQDEMVNMEKNLNETRIEKKRLEEVLIEESTMRIRERIKAAKDAAGSQQSNVKRESYSEKTSSQSQERKEISHIVKKGETLQSIAKKYYNDERYWNTIYQANKDNIERGGILKDSQVLIVPPISINVAGGEAKEQKQEEPAKTVPVVVTPVVVTPVVVTTPKENAKPQAQKTEKKEEKQEPVHQAKKHIVEPGDNLQGIAKKYYNDSARWKEIYNANKDKVVGGQVTPGQELIIP